MVLLLEAGDNIEDGVYIVRRQRHCEAGGGAGGAADEEIVLRECDVHA